LAELTQSVSHQTPGCTLDVGLDDATAIFFLRRCNNNITRAINAWAHKGFITLDQKNALLAVVNLIDDDSTSTPERTLGSALDSLEEEMNV